MVTAAALVILVMAPFARAQADEGDKKAAAQVRFKQGRAFYEAGAYEEAIEQYRAGFEETQWPGFLFNIGLAYERSGDKRAALTAYKRYLELDPTGEASNEAAEYIARLQNEIEKEEAVAREKRERERAAVEAQRERERERAAAAARQRAEKRARHKRRLRLAGLLTAAAGLVSLGVGVKFGVDAKHASDEISAHEDGPWTESLITRYEAGERAERNMFIFTGVAAGALVTGGLLYLFGRGDGGVRKDDRMSLRATAGRNSATLLLTRRF